MDIAKARAAPILQGLIVTCIMSSRTPSPSVGARAFDAMWAVFGPPSRGYRIIIRLIKLTGNTAAIPVAAGPRTELIATTSDTRVATKEARKGSSKPSTSEIAPVQIWRSCLCLRRKARNHRRLNSAHKLFKIPSNALQRQTGRVRYKR
jgi:hypothetical protein